MSTLRVAAIACLLCGALCLGLSGTGTGWRIFRNGDDIRYFGPRSAVLCKAEKCRRVDYGPEVARYARINAQLKMGASSGSILTRYRMKSALDDARNRNFKGWMLTITLVAGVLLFVALAAGLFVGRRSVWWTLRGTQLISLGAWVSAALVFCVGAIAALGLSGTLSDKWVSMGWPFGVLLLACVIVVVAGFFARLSGRRDAAALDEALEEGTGAATCPACNEKVRPGARFCDACGHALSEDGPTT